MLQDEGFVGAIKGSKWKANFVGQIHVSYDDTLICCSIWCDRYKVIKSVVQVSIVNLTAKTSNEQKNLVEEAFFSY